MSFTGTARGGCAALCGAENHRLQHLLADQGAGPVVDGHQLRAGGELPKPGQNRVGAGSPTHYHLADLGQAGIPAELANGDDQILPGDHDNLGKIGAQLQRPQGM